MICRDHVTKVERIKRLCFVSILILAGKRASTSPSLFLENITRRHELIGISREYCRLITTWLNMTQNNCEAIDAATKIAPN